MKSLQRVLNYILRVRLLTRMNVMSFSAIFLLLVMVVDGSSLARATRLPRDVDACHSFSFIPGELHRPHQRHYFFASTILRTLHFFFLFGFCSAEWHSSSLFFPCRLETLSWTRRERRKKKCGKCRIADATTCSNFHTNYKFNIVCRVACAVCTQA